MKATSVVLFLGLVLGMAVCSQAYLEFDVPDMASPQEWEAYAATLPHVPQDPETGDWPAFNVSTACNMPLQKQCDSRWGSNRIGTSSTTICKVGCAISSLSMYLSSRGKAYNPGTINTWLTRNGGFAQGNLLVWSAATKLGLVWRGQQRPTQQELINGLRACHGIIANVNNGGHWVLLTGYQGNGVFTVNDPGFNRNTYPFREMGVHSVYH